jgi:hypothetical protein
MEIPMRETFEYAPRASSWSLKEWTEWRPQVILVSFLGSILYVCCIPHCQKESADENETAEAAKQIKVECKEKFSHRKKQAKKQQKEKKERKNSTEKET